MTLFMLLGSPPLTAYPRAVVKSFTSRWNGITFTSCFSNEIKYLDTLSKLTLFVLTCLRLYAIFANFVKSIFSCTLKISSPSYCFYFICSTAAKEMPWSSASFSAREANFWNSFYFISSSLGFLVCKRRLAHHSS